MLFSKITIVVVIINFHPDIATACDYGNNVKSLPETTGNVGSDTAVYNVASYLKFSTGGSV